MNVIMGDASYFFTRPVSAIMLTLALLSFSVSIIRLRIGKRKKN